MHVFDPEAVPGLTGDECRSLLMRDTDQVAVAKGKRGLALRSEVRTAALREHDGRESVLTAARSIPSRPLTATQRVFEHWLETGTFTGEEAAAIEGLERIGYWLRSVPWAHEDAHRLQAEVKRHQRIRGLNALGGAEFVGRADQRAALRELALRGPGPEPEVVVLDAIGGMGKSALLARFELDLEADHARAITVHIDFDDVAIDVTSPGSVLAQIFATLGTQLEELRLYAEDFAALSAEGVGDQAALSHIVAQASSRYQRTIASANMQMRRALAAKQIGNLVVVLDTFERALRKSREVAVSILRMVWQIVDGIPGVVVIAGRGVREDLEKVSVPFKLHSLALRELRRDDARELLRRQGITDDAVAATILELVPLRPLTLRLAARAENLSRLQSGDTALRDAVSRQLVDGFLHLRILDHLDEPRIAKLIHPGFVLRRLTPDLILALLATLPDPPVADESDATDLFEGLRRVNDLVTEGTDRPGLVLRDEVRGELLDLMREDDPVTVEAMHRSAAEYFARRLHESGARLESAYHQLMLVNFDQHQVELLLAGLEPEELADLVASVDEMSAIAAAVVRRVAGKARIATTHAMPTQQGATDSVAELQRRFALLVKESRFAEADDFVTRQGPFNDLELLQLEARLRRRQQRADAAVDAAKRARSKLPRGKVSARTASVRIELDLVMAWAAPSRQRPMLQSVLALVGGDKLALQPIERLAAAADAALLADRVADTRGMFREVVVDCLREVSNSDLKSNRVVLLAAVVSSGGRKDLARALELGALDQWSDVTRTMLVATMLAPLQRARLRSVGAIKQMLTPPTTASLLSKQMLGLMKRNASQPIIEAVRAVLAEEHRAATEYVEGWKDLRAKALDDLIAWLDRNTDARKRADILRPMAYIHELYLSSGSTAEAMVLVSDRERRLVDLLELLVDAFPTELATLAGLRYSLMRPPAHQWIRHQDVIAKWKSLHAETVAAARKLLASWSVDWVFRSWNRPPKVLVLEALELLNLSGTTPATVLAGTSNSQTSIEAS